MHVRIWRSPGSSRRRSVNALTLLVVLCVVFANRSHGQFALPTDIDLPEAYMVQDIVQADLNGDGFPDVLCTTGMDDRIAWYPNDGTGLYGDQRVISLVTEDVLDIAAGDIDNDGHIDVVCALSTAGTIGWFRNNGLAMFTAEEPLALGLIDVRDMQLADLDEDNDLDLIAAVWSTEQVVSLMNEGNGAFAAPTIIASATEEPALQCEDLNSDGHIDLLLSDSGPPDVLYWCANDGIGNLGAATAIPLGFMTWLKFAVCDMDDDGDADVIYGEQDTLSWVPNNGQGLFGTPTAVVHDQYLMPERIRPADLNGDGTVDLLFQSSSPDRLEWCAALGDGEWGPRTPLITPEDSYGPAIVLDDDGDGDNDIVLAEWTDDMIYRAVNDGAGAFQLQHVSHRSLRNPYQVVAADINGDGLVDIVGAGYNYGDVVWYPGIDGNKWGPKHPIHDYAIRAHAVQAGDLDGDGDIDVVTAGAETSLNGQLIWHRNDGAGNFTMVEVLGTAPIGSPPILIGDVDADGNQDILFASNNITIYRGSGSGNFDPATYVASGGYVTDMVLADVNGDSAHDLAYLISDLGADGLRVNTNNGDGTFALYTAIDGWDDQIGGGLDVGDIDDDGDPDIVAMTGAMVSTVIGWYENLGQMEWGALDTIENVPSEYRLALTDLDQDGDLDLLTNRLEDEFELGYYTNDGAGTFSSFIPVPQGDRNSKLWTVADVDADGDEDALVYTSDWIGLHENLALSPYRLEGEVYFDVNGNGQREAGEEGFGYNAVSISPAGEQPFTDVTGAYSVVTGAGAHVISSLVDPFVWELTSDSAAFHPMLTMTDPVSSGHDFGYLPALDTTLVMISPVATARCGLNAGWIDMRNMGSTIVSGVVAVEIDTLVTFLGSELPYDSIVGRTVYWTINDLFFYEIRRINLNLEMAGEEAVGDSIHLLTSFTTIGQPGEAVFTWEGTWPDILICAVDPNDKRVQPQGYGLFGAVPMDTEWLTYTIRFQNTGTAPATTVVIRDLLVPELDRNSLQILGSSHPLTGVGIGPDHVAEFRFENIQLPDSGADEIASHGFVRFRIRPGDGLPSETEITNCSAIYFDANAPVITNTTMTTLIDCADHHPSIFWWNTDTLFASAGERYQWFLNGDSLPGADTSVLAVTDPGDYTVQVTSVHGCTTMTPPYAVISMHTPTSEAFHYQVAPNPTTGDIHLTSRVPFQGNEQVELLNLHGQAVRKVRALGSRTVAIPRGELSPGLYMVRVLRDGVAIGSTRVIIE